LSTLLELGQEPPHDDQQPLSDRRHPGNHNGGSVISFLEQLDRPVG